MTNSWNADTGEHPTLGIDPSLGIHDKQHSGKGQRAERGGGTGRQKGQCQSLHAQGFPHLHLPHAPRHPSIGTAHAHSQQQPAVALAWEVLQQLPADAVVQLHDGAAQLLQLLKQLPA